MKWPVQNRSSILVNVTIFCRFSQPDVGFEQSPFLGSVCFVQYGSQDGVRTSLQTVEHQSFSSGFRFPTSDESKSVLWKFPIFKNFLFPRQEINLNGEMILKSLSNTRIGLMILQNGKIFFDKAQPSKTRDIKGLN